MRVLLICIIGLVNLTRLSVSSPVRHVRFSSGSKVVDRYLRFQTLYDARDAEYAPNLSTNYEIIPELGTLTLDAIVPSRMGLVYSVIERDDVLIKYMVDCGTGVHPLINDFWFQSESHEYGISPKMYFLSPPTWLNTAPRAGISMKLVTDDDSSASADGSSRVKRKCVEGTIRYLVMARPGINLEATRDISLPEGLRIGVDLVNMIETLHTTDNIHGSISLSVISRSASDPSKLELTGFEHARACESESDDILIREDLTMNQLDQSPWMMHGYPRARRDDVYNVIYTIAQLVNGQAMQNYAESLRPKKLVKWKRSTNIFATTDQFDPIQKLEKDSGAIWRGLKQIMIFVNSLDTSVKTPIDYGELKRLFENVIALAE